MSGDTIENLALAQLRQWGTELDRQYFGGAVTADIRFHLRPVVGGLAAYGHLARCIEFDPVLLEPTDDMPLPSWTRYLLLHELTHARFPRTYHGPKFRRFADRWNGEHGLPPTHRLPPKQRVCMFLRGLSTVTCELLSWPIGSLVRAGDKQLEEMWGNACAHHDRQHANRIRRALRRAAITLSESEVVRLGRDLDGIGGLFRPGRHNRTAGRYAAGRVFMWSRHVFEEGASDEQR